MPTIAYFISSHGYGHAARACAVMERLNALQASSHFLIFTQVPQWFFEDSLPEVHFTYIPTFTDVGFVQKSPFEIDFPGTIRVLRAHLPFPPEEIHRLARELSARNCRAVFSDVPALGLLVAHEAGLPSILIENFTWDWLYRHYAGQRPDFSEFADYLARQYALATLHIKAKPFTFFSAKARTVSPVARYPRHSAEETRRALGIPTAAKAVLISTGGIKTRHRFMDRLKLLKDIYFIIPNDVAQKYTDGNLIVLPHHSEFFHPDLVQAADLLVCKSGYSTVAEAYLLHKPLLLITRPDFPESPFIEAFVRENFVHRFVTPQQFTAGQWLEALETLVRATSNAAEKPLRPNGAEEIVRLCEKFL